MYDLLVVGAGPVGLATALFGARAGLNTAVLDPRPAPIDKACGEGLMPSAVSALQSLGVQLAGQPFRGIRYLNEDRMASADFKNGVGLGVRRTALQSGLREQLSAAGISVHQASAASVRQDETGVWVDDVRARYLAAADGLHSPIRRQLGLDVVSPDQPRWGLRQHFPVAPWSDYVEVYWSTDAEAYVTPVGPNLVGVAVLSGVRRPFADHLRLFPTLAARLPAHGSTAVRGAGPLRQRSRARTAGRVLLVGDASGYIDALTGEGIAVGVACARSLVDCVRRDDPDSYEQAWSRASRRYRVMTSSLLWASRHKVVRSALVPAASRAPWLLAAGIHQMAK
jgi:flavin-dependent dehydrogenase